MIRRCVRYEQDEYACLTCTRDECAYDEEERIQSQLLRAYEQKERGFDGPPSALLEYDDREQTLTAWVRELGLDYMTVYMRMRRGATVEEALTKELRMPRKEKKRRMDLNKLAMEVHAAAVEKGFWRAFDAEERNIACLHAEISEAVQADRLGMPICEIERDGGKPEGVGVELADFAMRLLDYAAYRGANLRPLVVAGTRHCSLPHLACRLHRMTSFMVTSVADKKAKLTRVSDCVETMIADVAEWLNANNASLINLIAMKMEYNKKRPELHGKRY